MLLGRASRPLIKVMRAGDSQGVGHQPSGYTDVYYANSYVRSAGGVFVGSQVTKNSTIPVSSWDGASCGPLRPLMSRLIGEIATYDPDVIVVMLGDNDISVGQGALSPADTAEQHRLFVTNLFVAKPSVRVVVTCIPPVDAASGYTTNANLTTANGIIATNMAALVTAGKPLWYVDCFAALLANPNGLVAHGGDHMHLWDSDYQIIAAAYQSALTAAIASGRAASVPQSIALGCPYTISPYESSDYPDASSAGASIYSENYEGGAGGWADGSAVPIPLTTDVTSPYGSSVANVTRGGSGGDYWSPTINVTPGVAYTLGCGIRWNSGGRPMVGISVNGGATIWVIGAAAYSGSLGTAQTVDNTLSTWQIFAHTFVAPVGATSIKITAELYDGDGNKKAGADSVYFDGWSLTPMVGGRLTNGAAEEVRYPPGADISNDQIHDVTVMWGTSVDGGVTIYLGSAKTVGSIRACCGHGPLNGIYAPASVVVSTSTNGSSYTTQATVTPPVLEGWMAAAFTPVSALYVRVTFTHASGSSWTSCSEIQVFPS